MKYIFLNLKRFDIPRSMGGVNDLAGVDDWGAHITLAISNGLPEYSDAKFVVFFPEAHILGAKQAQQNKPVPAFGCQGIHFDNVAPGHNFGALTSSLPAAAAVALGCEWVMIGHCEERNKLKTILQLGGGNMSAVNTVLGKAVNCAIQSNLKVLYCIGETEDEKPIKEQVLKQQLETIIELHSSNKTAEIVIGYEPVWAIGPGKIPPDAAYIKETADYIKSITNCPVVYGGGLKTENAKMLAGINCINGGLIALTRFQGDIGFYPEDYFEIVSKYLGGN